MNLYKITESRSDIEHTFHVVASGLTAATSAAIEATEKSIIRIELVGTIRHIHSDVIDRLYAKLHAFDKDGVQ